MAELGMDRIILLALGTLVSWTAWTLRQTVTQVRDLADRLSRLEGEHAVYVARGLHN